MLERREPSLREIIDFRKKTAAVHIETPPDYTVVRGLWDSNVTKIKTEGITQRRESGYDSIFGVFEGKRMSEWIEELIGKRGKVRVLDIGCGAGRFLNDLKEKFGDDVQAYGVSASRYGEYGALEEKG